MRGASTAHTGSEIEARREKTRDARVFSEAESPKGETEPTVASRFDFKRHKGTSLLGI